MMRENVLDVLLYLFENYLDDDAETYADRDVLTVELEAAGFPRSEVGKAFDWLESLAVDEDKIPTLTGTSSVRIFNDEEMARLDVRCRGFLRHLENVGILDAAQREVVIDRILALETDTVDLDDVKWVILMVLFNQPGQETALARMEDLVFEDRGSVLH
jgi:Smg protein